jgi:hypothetical protein
VLPPSTNGLSKKQGASSYSTAAAPLPADIKRVLFSAAQVQEKVAELAAQICKDHKGKPLALIGVLNGAFIFTSGEKGSQQHPCRAHVLGCFSRVLVMPAATFTTPSASACFQAPPSAQSFADAVLTATQLSVAPAHHTHLHTTAAPRADLAREVSKEIPDVKVDFMRASSYGSASESSGDVTVKGVSNLAKWENYNIVLVRVSCLSSAACWCCCCSEFSTLPLLRQDMRTSSRCWGLCS